MGDLDILDEGGGQILDEGGTPILQEGEYKTGVVDGGLTESGSLVRMAHGARTLGGNV